MPLVAGDGTFPPRTPRGYTQWQPVAQSPDRVESVARRYRFGIQRCFQGERPAPDIAGRLRLASEHDSAE
jgi:hypothetical protein